MIQVVSWEESNGAINVPGEKRTAMPASTAANLTKENQVMNKLYLFFLLLSRGIELYG